ncbi:microtubule nucleation factor SSNA1-like isoform X1 [Anthonomus grandis grandis]|uniref:microtubule nucleation factor SSNA1-like isoform X1 n=1 Tax=Anthonomus grandis grandis TaxID=2921223 RepID=UPI0021657DC2|nr:microtubule nucleation factor SSNA1-like isoform X1 [Anthonomus grandis grandis]
MSEHGAALQTFNEQLVKCLEELKSKRNDLVEVIQREEAEKIVLEKNIRALQDKLAQLNNSLSQHRAMCSNYDKTIEDTELGFKKILESSQTLLQVAQHGANTIGAEHEHLMRYSVKNHN